MLNNTNIKIIIKFTNAEIKMTVLIPQRDR